MRATAAPAAILVVLACLAPAAAADTPPSPQGVLVSGGEGTWHADRRFTVNWSIPGDDSGLEIRYSVLDPSGERFLTGRRNWPARQLEVELPAVPGIYTARIRLVDGDGDEGQVATARLRFDDTRPQAVAPRAPQGWVGRNDFPLRVALTAGGEPPPSGIRGYAVSIAPAPGRMPCAAPDRCTEEETAAPDGEGVTLSGAPEGTGRLRVLAVSGAGLSSPTAGETTLRVDTTDPHTRLRGLPDGWTRGPVRLSAQATDAGAGMVGERAHTAIRIDDDAPAVAPGAEVETPVIAEGTHRVAYYASDAAGNTDDGSEANGRVNHRPRIAMVRIDRTAPRSGFLPQDPGDPELLRVRIRDPLSGPDPDRGWIGVRPVGSSGRFLSLPAASPGGRELRARWDSGAYPLGLYEFRAVVFDAAGNRAATGLRESGAPMLLANPLKTTTALQAGFGGRVLRRRHCRRKGGRKRCRLYTVADFARRPSRRTVPHGRGLALSGRLVAGAARAPGPRPVRIVERFALGARPATRATTVWTKASGEFSTRLMPGATREVTVSYGGNRVLASAAGPVLRLGVRSGVRLGASSGLARVGGAPLILRGKVRAQPGEIPSEGCAVQLQFRLAGLPWKEFRTVQTNRRGRFRLAYRFSDDDSRGARFRFRAFVPAQSEWPYEPGSSRPLAVEGV